MTVATIDSTTPSWVNVLVPARQVAEIVAGTEFVPASMRNKPDVVTACIMYGNAIGLDPMVALQSIHVIEGRPAPSAELMRALVFSAGHTITVHEMTGTRCRVSGQRAGRPDSERVVVEWTVDMARSAGLLGRQNWQRYPRAMLLARATSDLARMLFPDVVKGLGYIAEDAESAAQLDVWATEDKAPAAKAPRVVGRKTSGAKAALERPQPPAEASPEPRPPIAPPPTPEPHSGESEPPSQPFDRDFEPIADTPRAVGLEDVPLPDLVPEQPIAEPTPRAAVGGGQLRGLHASLRNVLGGSATSDDRHALLSAILDKPVTDTGKITRSDAGRALIALERIETGADVIVMLPEGRIEIQTLDESTGELSTPADDPWSTNVDDGAMFDEPERRPTGRRDWDAP